MIAWMCAAAALANDPAALEGVYDVVALTEAPDGKQPFVDRMRRLGLALKQDCFVERRTYDFSSLAQGVVVIREQWACKKGGLGEYRAQLSVDVPANRTGPEALVLEGAVAWASMTRVQRAREVGLPAQWAAPPVEVVFEPITVKLVFEKARRGQLPPLVLDEGGRQWHLEPRKL